MRHALFIHGFNSDEHSSTGAKVKDVLNKLGFSTMIKTFDMLNPVKTKKEIEEILKNNSFDIIVGHSLGGFYTLVAELPAPSNIKKIIINPSISPENDLKKLASIKEEILQDFATLNEEKRKNTTVAAKSAVFALFGKHDELLKDEERQPYVNLFLEHYGNNYIMLDCTHRPDEESLNIGIPQALRTLGIID